MQLYARSKKLLLDNITFKVMSELACCSRVTQPPQNISKLNYY